MVTQVSFFSLFIAQISKMEQTNETHNNFTILPFGSDISLHREDIYQFAEKDSDPMGHEQLQEDGNVMLSLARRESRKLSQEDFHCLEAYYHRRYESHLVVDNIVQKIKKIKVLGDVYKSRLTGRGRGSQIYAYRPDDYENDDLEGVVNTEGQEHLRAGTIEYFFFHETKCYENGDYFPTNHCFAFVSWYKNPRVGVDSITSGTSERNKPFRNEYEAKSSYSILPVHKLYSRAHIRRSINDSLIIALQLTRSLA